MDQYNYQQPASPPPSPHIYPEPGQQPKYTKDHRDGIKNILSTVGLLLLAPLLALFITTFIFHSYEVYGPSMEPTMESGDRLIVLKAPRTWAKIRNKQYMPSRGEIVVFDKPDLALAGEHGKQLIKRVIGLPGDRVVVQDGQITVYNDQHSSGYKVDQDTDYGSKIPTTEGTVDTTVKEGEVFVCGDNRQNSLDSRYFGSIPASDIVGTAEYRMYPFGQQRSF